MGRTFVSTDQGETSDQGKRDFGSSGSSPGWGPAFRLGGNESPERAEASAEARSGFLVSRTGSRKQESRSRKTIKLLACQSHGNGLLSFSRQRGNLEAYPTSRYGAAKAEPGRIPAGRVSEHRETGASAGRKSGRGSFGIVERISTASGSHDSQHLLGDEKSGPTGGICRKAGANHRIARPRLRPTAFPTGVGSPARFQLGREPREG